MNGFWCPDQESNLDHLIKSEMLGLRATRTFFYKLAISLLLHRLEKLRYLITPLLTAIVKAVIKAAIYNNQNQSCSWTTIPKNQSKFLAQVRSKFNFTTQAII